MGRVAGESPRQTPSPRMKNNYNPMFHDAQATPEPSAPVYEKQMIETEQRYPVNQPIGVPIGRPVPPINTNNIGVMGNQPYRPHIVPPPVLHNQPSNWTSGLFDCMNDGENAIITLFFPFVTFGQIAEIIDQGSTSCGTGGMMYGLVCCCLGLPCIYSCTFRAKLRSKFGLPDAPAPDWITHFFCEHCALCQEYRELKNRGLDPAIGWIGNVQRQQMVHHQQQMMTPPAGQRMMG